MKSGQDSSADNEATSSGLHDVETWQQISVDSYLESGPRTIPTAPSVRGGHELLPFELLRWEDFESLQLRILRDVEGLRHTLKYGKLGQSQQGLDLIGQSADGSWLALQSKRVRDFGRRDLIAAVTKFRDSARPFEVSRFVVGVSEEIRDTATIHELLKLQRELHPVRLELWEQTELSNKLRTAPLIIVDYFGKEVAQSFCGPLLINMQPVPRPDAVALREAIARSADSASHISETLDRARVLAESYPTQALELVETAQAELQNKKHVGLVRRFDPLRASLLVKVERGTEATRGRLDALWDALDHGLNSTADVINHELEQLASDAGQDSAGHHHVAQTAVDLYNNPLAWVPDINDLRAPDAVDQARLMSLAGETALANDNLKWLESSATAFLDAAAQLPHGDQFDIWRIRLQILAAEGTGGWATTLASARKLKLGHALAALVQARYGRYCAFNQDFADADESWDEATGNATLAEKWTDAARWTSSRRTFRTRWNPFAADDLLPTQISLKELGPTRTILPRDESAAESALHDLDDSKLRSAAIAAQRALRDAVTSADWSAETRSRRRLASILSAAGEHHSAANHLVLAGDMKALGRLTTDPNTPFLDVTRYLQAPGWWVAGAAYTVLATQSDLIPDSLIQFVADNVLTVFSAVSEEILVDIPAFTGSHYKGAFAALAGISKRLTSEDALAALTFFESQPALEPNQYRHHDEYEATATAGIIDTHPALVDRGLRHLIGLLGRTQHAQTPKTREALTDRLAQARPIVQALARAGNSWAQDFLDSEQPDTASADAIALARARLEAPLVHTPGVTKFGSGSRSVHDSVLVSQLPGEEQMAALQQLIARGGDPLLPSLDRASYLIAASNLTRPADPATQAELFDQVLSLVSTPPESRVDADDAQFQHPLGAFRMNRRRDSRGEALHLAGTLADTQSQKVRVRDAAFGLIGNDEVSEYWVTSALQRLGNTIADDVAFLSGQNWAMRSLSAILWAETTEPIPVGARLAADPDVRVRRTLATNLIQLQTEDVEQSTEPHGNDRSETARRSAARDSVLGILRNDSHYSVRHAAAPATPRPNSTPSGTTG